MPDPTPVDRDEVARLLRAGLTPRAAAARMDCTDRTIQRIRKDLLARGVDLPAPAHRHTYTPEELSAINELLDDGASLAEAMRSIGRPPKSWARRFRGRGWSNAEVIDWARAHRVARKKGIVL